VSARELFVSFAVQGIEAPEFGTPLWRKITAHLRDRIELHRTTLEDPDLDDKETAMVRARIAECRHLLNLPRWIAAGQEIAPPDTDYY